MYFARTLNTRAQVRQFEEWNMEVYGKIQGRVAEQLEQTSSGDITRKRNVEFQKFLDTTNAKVSHAPLCPCLQVAGWL
jgi:hypothetical protein